MYRTTNFKYHFQTSTWCVFKSKKKLCNEESRIGTKYRWFSKLKHCIINKLPPWITLVFSDIIGSQIHILIYFLHERSWKQVVWYLMVIRWSFDDHPTIIRCKTSFPSHTSCAPPRCKAWPSPLVPSSPIASWFRMANAAPKTTANIDASWDPLLIWLDREQCMLCGIETDASWLVDFLLLVAFSFVLYNAWIT